MNKTHNKLSRKEVAGKKRRDTFHSTFLIIVSSADRCCTTQVCTASGTINDSSCNHYTHTIKRQLLNENLYTHVYVHVQVCIMCSVHCFFYAALT